MADVVDLRAKAVISIADDDDRMAAIVDILKAEATRRPGFGQLRVDAHRDGGMIIHIAGIAGPWHMTEPELMRFVQTPTIDMAGLVDALNRVKPGATDQPDLVSE